MHYNMQVFKKMLLQQSWAMTLALIIINETTALYNENMHFQKEQPLLGFCFEEILEFHMDFLSYIRLPPLGTRVLETRVHFLNSSL